MTFLERIVSPFRRLKRDPSNSTSDTGNQRRKPTKAEIQRAIAAADDPDRSTRLAAIDFMTDQSILRQIAWGAHYWDARCAAILELTDRDLLNKLASSGRTFCDRDAAYTRLSSVDDPIRFVRGSGPVELRTKVIERIADQRVLDHLARKGDDYRIRRAATARLTNTSSLEHLARFGKGSCVQEAAISGLDDQPALMGLAFDRNLCEDLRRVALLKLTPASWLSLDHDVILKLLLECPDRGSEVIEKLSDYDLLSKVLKITELDYKFRKPVEDRLEKLGFHDLWSDCQCRRCKNTFHSVGEDCHCSGCDDIIHDVQQGCLCQRCHQQVHSYEQRLCKCANCSLSLPHDVGRDGTCTRCGELTESNKVISSAKEAIATQGPIAVLTSIREALDREPWSVEVCDLGLQLCPYDPLLTQAKATAMAITHLANYVEISRSRIAPSAVEIGPLPTVRLDWSKWLAEWRVKIVGYDLAKRVLRSSREALERATREGSSSAELLATSISGDLLVRILRSRSPKYFKSLFKESFYWEETSAVHTLRVVISAAEASAPLFAALCSGLNDEREDVRDAAALALAYHHDERAIQRLEEMVASVVSKRASQERKRFVEALFVALQRLDPLKVVDLLIGLLVCSAVCCRHSNEVPSEDYELPVRREIERYIAQRNGLAAWKNLGRVADRRTERWSDLDDNDEHLRLARVDDKRTVRWFIETLRRGETADRTLDAISQLERTFGSHCILCALEDSRIETRLQALVYHGNLKPHWPGYDRYDRVNRHDVALQLHAGCVRIDNSDELLKLPLLASSRLRKKLETVLKSRTVIVRDAIDWS